MRLRLLAHTLLLRRPLDTLVGPLLMLMGLGLLLLTVLVAGTPRNVWVWTPTLLSGMAVAFGLGATARALQHLGAGRRAARAFVRAVEEGGAQAVPMLRLPAEAQWTLGPMLEVELDAVPAPVQCAVLAAWYDAPGSARGYGSDLGSSDPWLSRLLGRALRAQALDALPWAEVTRTYAMMEGTDRALGASLRVAATVAPSGPDAPRIRQQLLRAWLTFPDRDVRLRALQLAAEGRGVLAPSAMA